VKARLRKRCGWSRTVMSWYGISRFPRRSELQYRDDHVGPKTKEAAAIHSRAL
jgi:hypothetical protein